LSELTSNVQTETVRLSKQTNIVLFINDVPTTSKNAKLVIFIVAPCINNIEYFIAQLIHSII